MSDDRTAPPSLFQRLREPAAINYLIMAGAGLLVYAMIMIGKDNNIGAVIAILLAIPGVLARWTAAPVLILMLTLLTTLDPGFQGLMEWVSGDGWRPFRQAAEFNLEDLLLAGGLLAYVIGHFRLTAIIHQSMPEDPTVQRDPDPKQPPRRPADLAPADELPRTLVIAAGCLICGQTGWLAIIMIERLSRASTSVFKAGTSRFLLMAWVTGITLMLVSAALIYMRSARMTKLEAAMSLRDEFFQENRRETDRLQRWRKWFKERMALRRRSGK